MPEMKNNFQSGRMNKDLDERLVPNGEYRDALNVELATSNDSDMGTLQTLKGNTFLGVDGVGGVCIGSIADDKSDKLYFMVAGDDYDRIIEYNYKDEEFEDSEEFLLSKVKTSINSGSPAPFGTSASGGP